MAKLLTPTMLLDSGLRRSSAQARACGVGGESATFAEYMTYRERCIDANDKPLRFELWRLRESGKRQSAEYVSRVNHSRKTPTPNVSPLPDKRRYTVVDIDASDTMLGDHTSGVETYRKPRNRITLPVATYLLSLPKASGVPLGADDDGNIDPRLSLLILSIYRQAIATRKEVK